MDQHAERVRRMFSSIAGRYDLLNRVLSLGLDIRWRRRAVRSLSLGEGCLFLDVCGGTGDLAAALTRTCPDAEAIVCDFAEPMLRIGQRKFKASPFGFHLVLGDALELPFPDGRFDALGCAFGVRNLSNLEAAFREFHRVLRPGGTLCILEFTAAEAGLLRRWVRWYIDRVVPFVGQVMSDRRDAYNYLSRSAMRFLSSGELAERMEECGFDVVECRPLTFGACSLLTGTRNPKWD
jgi:demethylmenaquinone methyltransferase/2-methoxy-6-polyprenyl-1,4-benzoquinol methylase